MNKRLLDKKVVKVSFNKPSNEPQQYFNYDLDVNFSSDEENFFNGKSEILWSRTGEYFEYPDSSQSFSDLTARTLSSCSWHNDEFDMKSTSKVNASLEAIDDALYEKIKSPFMTELVFQECCDWAEKFPYLRIKGEQINKPIEDNYILYSSRSTCSKEYNSLSLNSGLHLEGTRLPLHASFRSRGVCIDCAGDNKVPHCFDEEKDDDEEYLALHKSDSESHSLQVDGTENTKSVLPVKQLQEKVLEKLVSEMWPSVLAFLEKLDHRNAVEDLQLPPIMIVAEQKRALNLPRPRTEGSSFMSTEFPKLNNILTVSPKILQKREFRNGHIVRPSSEMSVSLRASSTSLKSISNQNRSSSLHTKGENISSKGSRRERDLENTCVVLPALEEDFQDTSSVLRGFHIEPSKKELVHKPELIPKNECETVSTSQENNYFLPPIQDKSYIPTNLKLTQNLFTFYGSPITPDKRKPSGSARNKKIISRPSTSISKKPIKNHEINENPLRGGIFISSRNISKTSGSLTERNSGVSHHKQAGNQNNQEKSVTLFPIVTPLTPHEDRNQSNRKGILHSFLGVKKR